MTIINFLEMLQPTKEVQVFLYEDDAFNMEMIADTTVEVLLKSSKPAFRELLFLSTGGYKGKSIITVVKPTK